MGITTIAPVVPETANDILLGEGIVYVNYGEAGQALMGATRGGSEFMLERAVRIINHDGASGVVKGLRRAERYVPKLTINLLKLTYTSLAYGLPCTVADGTDSDGTYKKITLDLDIEDTDVLDNITFLGYKADGKYCEIKVKNALNIDSITFEFTEKNEIVAELIYTGFYTYAAPTTLPFEINEEV